jgi:DNA-binding PadR family transcriptional regulator
MRRLDSGGLLHAREDFTGQRRRALYEITQNGLKVLRSWVDPSALDWSATVPVDPLRIRVRFLEVLSPLRRSAFLSNARDQLRIQIENAETECKSFDPAKDPCPYLVARGVARIARARLAWIKEVCELLA